MLELLSVVVGALTLIFTVFWSLYNHFSRRGKPSGVRKFLASMLILVSIAVLVLGYLKLAADQHAQRDLVVERLIGSLDGLYAESALPELRRRIAERIQSSDGESTSAEALIRQLRQEAETALGSAKVSNTFRRIYQDGLKSPLESELIDQLASRLEAEDGISRLALDKKEEEWRRRLLSASTALARGIELASQGKQATALTELLAALEYDQENSWTWANICACYIGLTRLDQALEACRRSTQEDPENWLGHYNLGSLYALLGNSRSAVRELSLATELVGGPVDGSTPTPEMLIQQMKSDRSLDSLRSVQSFQELVGKRQ